MTACIRNSASSPAFFARKSRLAKREKLSNQFMAKSSVLLCAFRLPMRCRPSIRLACSCERASSEPAVARSSVGKVTKRIASTAASVASVIAAIGAE